MNYPIPQPDRRLIPNNHSNSNNNINNNQISYGNGLLSSFKANLDIQQQLNRNNSFNNNYTSNHSNRNLKAKPQEEEYELRNTMTVIKLKQIEDMRHKILTVKLLNDKSHYLPSQTSYPDQNHSNNTTINNCNIILFGPSGSGKSSFIKTLYQSLYNNPILPPDPMRKLIIKGNYENEGTLFFTRLHLKEETHDSSGLILCDTRGHIQKNDKEMAQFKVMIEGNIKEDTIIEQRTHRNPTALWEFWKNSNDLFPSEIFKSEGGNGNSSSGICTLQSIPHAIVLVFDGSCDKIITEEDSMFYKDIVAMSRRKGYDDIHVILTRVDIFEKFLNEQVKHLPESDRITKMNIAKDEKIENVIDILGVNRSSIHFIENYHEDYDYGEEGSVNNKKINENNLEIDYNILKTLGDLINSSEMFILNSLNRSENCCVSCC